MSTSPSSSKQVTTSKSPEQTKWMGEALDVYGPTLGQGENIFQGDRIAPMTETQTQASDVQGFLDRFAPYRDMPMFGETGTALSGVLSGATGAQKITPEATESYYKGVIEDPARKRHEEDVLPALRESFAGPGFWNKARAKEQFESTQDLSNWLGEQRASLEWDVGETNRQIEEAKAGRALSAIGPGIEYGQVPTREAQQRLAGRAGVFDLAGAPQKQEQAEINMAVQKFAEENRITSQEDMQILLALLGMDYGSAVGKSEGAGLGYSALSGLAGGFGTGMGFGIGSNLPGT